MRGMAIVFLSLCVAGAAHASSLVYVSDSTPASTPSVITPAETRRDADVHSVQSATQPMPGNSVVQMGEAEMPVAQETVSAIPDRAGPAHATMVIRDGVVGSALPRRVAKPAVATGKQPATAVSAKTGKGGQAKQQKPDAAR